MMNNKVANINQVISAKIYLKRKDEDNKKKSQYFVELNKNNVSQQIDDKNLDNFKALIQPGSYFKTFFLVLLSIFYH